MSIYQCFFFSEGRIRNWENVACETNSSLRTLIARRLVNGAWDAAEGWLQDKLVYRVERSLAGYNGSCSPAAVPVRRRSLTSSEVAARAVSPASRKKLASHRGQPIGAAKCQGGIQ